MKSNSFYKGQEGALLFIADIANNYDNAKTVEDFKALIDEIRTEALKALQLKENYNFFHKNP